MITAWARHRHKESGSRDNNPGEQSVGIWEACQQGQGFITKLGSDPSKSDSTRCPCPGNRGGVVGDGEGDLLLVISWVWLFGYKQGYLSQASLSRQHTKTNRRLLGGFVWCSWHLAAVTKYHRLSGLQQCNLLSYLSGSPSEMGVTGLKPRGRLKCIPSRDSRGELIFLLSSS